MKLARSFPFERVLAEDDEIFDTLSH